MSSSRIEHVFYNAHSKVSNYVLRHTSHRLRSAIEHAVLGLAVCGFCVVILSHRTFVHREDVASIRPGGGPSCDDDDASGEGGHGLLGLGFIGEGRGVSVYSIVVQMVLRCYAWMVSSERPESLSERWMSRSAEKTIPVTCLKSVPGFREDADVNHILLQYGADSDYDPMQKQWPGSQAFTIHRGAHEQERIISGSLNTSTQQTCSFGAPREPMRPRSLPFGFPREEMQAHEECPADITQVLAQRGYLPIQSIASLETRLQRTQPTMVYSYSHSQGLLRLPPSLQHIHNITTQFIIASPDDSNCFGDPFLRSIIFRLVGPDTVILNWILGLQHAAARPRFVYHWSTKKELDLDVFDMDNYAFSGKSGGDGHGAYESMPATSQSPWHFASINNAVAGMQKNPAYRFLRFLTFKLLVLLSTLLIFFLTTSLVSFTFQETQDRMLEFTLQLQTRVRARMPLGGLILGHVLENLVFVPIMVGMIFFLIEFYGGDKFLAFMVLSMVWVCEVFSAISIRSVQGMHFFPRVFFLYFTLFHVYHFSCPVGFTYASLASTILFLLHTMLFFLNRYELPALHAGLITPQSPRMVRHEVDIGRVDADLGNIASPPRLQPSSTPLSWADQGQPPPIPQVSSSDDRSNVTAPTAPMSSTMDFTPLSDQQPLLPPSRPGPMRSYVAAASNSLLSIRSLASGQSTSSLAGDRTTSPNLIFFGLGGFSDSAGAVDGDEDSYVARAMSSQ